MKTNKITFTCTLATTLISLFTYFSCREALAMLPTVKLGDQEVKLEVASSSEEEIESSLMYHTSMPETQEHGLFSFTPSPRNILDITPDSLTCSLSEM
jgi:hypothetical protein